MSRAVYGGMVKREGSVFLDQRFYSRPSLKFLNKLRRDVENLSVYLRNVTIEHSDFVSVCSNANNGDFVYLDTPYYYDAGDGHAVYNRDRVENERLIIHDVWDTMDEMTRRASRSRCP